MLQRSAKFFSPDHTPATRWVARTSDFQLISLRPYHDYDSECNPCINMEKPFRYDAQVKSSTDTIVGSAKYIQDTISCADDICYHAVKLKTNMEVVANGIQLSLPEALLEASRRPEAEHCRYIVIEHLLLKQIEQKSAVVLENTAVPPDCDKALVVSLKF